MVFLLLQASSSPLLFFCHSVRGLAAVQGRRRHVLYNASLTRMATHSPVSLSSNPPSVEGGGKFATQPF